MHEKREWYEKGPHWVSRPDVVTPAEEHWELDAGESRRAMLSDEQDARSKGVIM